ncbi:MAG: hypothetical protein MJ252_22530 [archaeon]|nr:hypothetical protein [archaeon]
MSSMKRTAKGKKIETLKPAEAKEESKEEKKVEPVKAPEEKKEETKIDKTSIKKPEKPKKMETINRSAEKKEKEREKAKQRKAESMDKKSAKKRPETSRKIDHHSGHPGSASKSQARSDEKKVNTARKIQEIDGLVEKTPKQLDIYQHLRINLNNQSKKSECECDGYPELYCIPCKTSVCKQCDYEKHKDHILLSRLNPEFTPKDIDEAFKETENTLTKCEIIEKSEKVKKELKRKVESITKLLQDEIQKMKQQKLDEIDGMFDCLIENSNNAKKKLEDLKTALKDYYKKTHKFYNIGQDANIDDYNSVFLLHYDLRYMAYQNEQTVKQITANMNDDAKNYQISLDLLGKEAKDEIKKVLFGSSYADSLENKVNAKLEINADIKKDISINDEQYNPVNHFKFSLEKLSNTDNKDITDRLMRYQEIDGRVRSTVFNSFTKHRNLRLVENELKVFENSKSKGADSLFCQRTIEKKPENASESAENLQTLSKKEKAKKDNRLKFLLNENEVTLNLPMIKKFYAYLVLEMYEKYYKMETKELQSSHADLMIRVDPDQEETDYAKIIEGTNTVIIYEKGSKRVTRKNIELVKNPIGYTVFPVGCRCLLLNGKLYITGGKDETGEHPNVLIYDLEREKLKRIMDLNEPRCFHTMVFNDVFETLMVVGGENCDSVEIFDPLANRWLFLPCLNFPRADIKFHFDKPKGLLYALFGREGGILDNKYSDVIEVLDLADFKKGWCKVDYNNKTDVSLKRFLNVFPLSSCLLLAYGGQTARKAKRIGVVIDLNKYEITKIDRQMAEQISTAAKRNQRLSFIADNLNLNNASTMNRNTLETKEG